MRFSLTHWLNSHVKTRRSYAIKIIDPMSHILSAVPTSSTASKVRIQRALLSVSDKTGLVEFASFLCRHNVELLSTGGTAHALREAQLPVVDVSSYTGFPEILDGRVKTLHPKIHGSILGVRNNSQHEIEMNSHGMLPIDLVVLNLYPFESAVAKNGDFATCIENIDIGGPSMLRSAAKNHQSVVICTSPCQYAGLKAELESNAFTTTLDSRRQYAAQAFSLSAKYDTAISSWMQKEITCEPTQNSYITRAYKHEMSLKYGCNPHQKPASIYSIEGSKLPFKVLNGLPGYINLLDAVNAYQLARELKLSLHLPAAASFKHVSPAGAAIAVNLTDCISEVYEVGNVTLTPLASAYLRARNADPLSSFGDFVALSDVVDEATASILKREVSDGIIAPGYEPAALDILRAKKNGKYIILQADADFNPPDMEYREVAGVVFAQERNSILINQEHVANIQTPRHADGQKLSKVEERDLVLAAITLKYTQSNSVGYAKDGQMIGVGAGQQSRVDCVKLAGRKVATWYLRQHPKVRNLEFNGGVKRQDRVNARVRYIEGDMAPAELEQFHKMFKNPPPALSEAEKTTFMKSLSDVSLASDAFFPFRDSIDHAAKLGVKYIIQPGGSNRDDEVKAACEENGIVMAFSDVRLFHH
uniref:Probable bifunctional purine synthesis protein putat n=1 Tax=Albugo laibachii Nc14 TaxID=890382 RepID=F0W009_9STRA|nr:probable bifunctional purine synthesis protein putat [Albugo laibachii Nc14]|eukprot:CCA14380.1 probable bifunctional purine synthesis protein putat [Albugo laibachii Nc14]